MYTVASDVSRSGTTSKHAPFPRALRWGRLRRQRRTQKIERARSAIISTLASAPSPDVSASISASPAKEPSPSSTASATRIPVRISGQYGIPLCATPTLNATALEEGLLNHPDKHFVNYIVSSCKNGVDIGYTGPRTFRCSQNWPSSLEHAAAVDMSIAKDISLERKLGPFPVPPFINFVGSPMGAFLKKRSSTKVRVIHDLSWPPGLSVNDHISSELFSLQYMSVDDVANIIKDIGRGALLAKLDLSDAFHHILVRPEDWELLGSTWKDKTGLTQYYVSAVLPFGLRSSPKLFNDFAQAAQFIMQYAGVTYVNHYLDDYITVGVPDSEECQNNMNIMTTVCHNLNFGINPDKVVSPCTALEFLGIWVDSEKMELRISAERLLNIMNELAQWSSRRRAKKRALLSLIGKLIFVSRVVRSGRSFVRRMIYTSKKAKHLHHFIRLDSEFRADLAWWSHFLPSWNGISMFYDKHWTDNADLELYTDASNTALSGYFNGSWFVELVQELEGNSINHRELRAVVLAAATWSQAWSGKRILFHCDNMSVVNILRSGTSRNPLLMALVRSLLYLAAVNCFEFSATYINTKDNDVADALSRLDWHRFWGLAPDASVTMTPPATIPQGF